MKNTRVYPKPLRANPIFAKIKQHDDEVAKNFKALTALHLSMSDK